MKKLTKILFFLILAASSAMGADFPNIDRTDKVHDRRYLDSMNVYNRRPIRVNQAGFYSTHYKYAYVADPKVKTFDVYNIAGEKKFNGTLSLIGEAVKPNIWINGAFSSITSEYEFGSQDSISTEREVLYRADFTKLEETGEYYIVVGKDTSAIFHINDQIYNAFLEKALMFYGIQRCGKGSHFHGACHLKDGSAIGHDLTGGWHDCGDHFKVSETLGYTTYMLSMVYLAYQDRAEDRYGATYADTVFTDGIPDLLFEAKVGADYLLKLYNASKADGLIAKGDMYHSVGVGDEDHNYWDVPEKQDAQPFSKGGPDRVVTDGAGANVSGMFVAAMANVAVGYKIYNPAYSDSLLAAAKDIYANVFKKAWAQGRFTTYSGSQKYYTGQGPMYDDGAAAALALWYATKDTTYQYDLYKNPNIFENSGNYRYNLDYFKGGFLGNESGFTPGGWGADYQNIHSFVLYAFQKLILNNESVAASYGLSPEERDTLSMRVMATYRKVLDNSTNDGDSVAIVNPATNGEPHEGASSIRVIKPYNLLWTSFDWGVIRYNMGTTNAIFLYYDLTKEEPYLKIALDNMYYILGANPWDISFLMGAGDKNPQHPHNRSANPDGYNAGGLPYEYRCPIGALMGGRAPDKTLIEDWSKYTSTETCADFTAQILFPAQSMAQPKPADTRGPKFSNIAGTPISDTSAIISWDSDEISLVTVFYSTSNDRTTEVKNIQQNLGSKGGAITINGLEKGKTYYFYLEGMDNMRNLTTDDNHGYWYSFTMTSGETKISGVTICQVDNRSAKIYWWSSDRMNGVVKYGTSPSALTEAQVSNGGAVMFHEVELTDLKPNTTYYFGVYSGTAKDEGYSFTTKEFATYANLTISMKPSNKNSNCTDWKNCNTFFLIITNNDTTVYEDLEIRLYLDKSVSANSYDKSLWSGTGQPDYTNPFDVIVGNYTTDLSGNGYLPITIKGTLYVSGSVFFELSLANNATFNGLENSWSLRAHTAADDPKNFNGIDLTRGPLYTSTSYTTSFIEEVNGKKERAFRADPYITAYYHGVYIYGYGPDYTPGNGPQVKQTFAMNFTSPFITPYTSVEKQEPATTYEFTTKVSPEGMIDAVELNGPNKEIITLASGDFSYRPANRTDSIYYKRDTVLQYGNNYIEWVAWHNRNANKQNSYDCACEVMRTNVEVDSIVIPPEQRYLKFSTDTVSTFLGKMVRVTVQLFDSTGINLITDQEIKVTLGTSIPGIAEFYASTEATNTTKTIDIKNGVAEFYIKGIAPAEAVLYAQSNSNSDIQYNAAQAVLIVAELPPYPIIDIATMLDTDCDNVPDAINITLSQPYEPNQSFDHIGLWYGNDSLTITSVSNLNGKSMIVKFEPTEKKVFTNPTGSITLWSNDRGSLEHAEDFYRDGIPPTLLSVSVLERLDTATSDKVYMKFSEPISAPEDWPVQLYAADKVTKLPAPNVKFTQIYNDSLNVWEIQIDFAADGHSLVTEGMFAQLLTSSNITDKSHNPISQTCGQPLLPITLKLLPVPLRYAIITDADEDGIAEHVDLEYERPIDKKHIPDQVSIIFGQTVPETLWVAGTALTFSPDSLKASINLEVPFSYGNTSGPYDGGTIGMANSGKVTQHIGSDASYESNEILAKDAVGPVFVVATLTSINSFDMLDIEISEAVDIRDSSLIFYRQKNENNDTAVYKYMPQSCGLVALNTRLQSFYQQDGRITITEASMLRMQPSDMGALVDKNGNTPSLNNPWIPISGSGKPVIKFNFHLRDQVVRTSANGMFSSLPGKPGIRLYALNPATKMLDLMENGIVVQSNINPNAIQGAVWEIEMDVPRGASSSEPAAWDSLTFKYNLPIYSNLGSYVNRAVGQITLTPGKHLSSAGKIVLYLEWPNMPTTGIQSENGRAVGTGAYIYKAQIDYIFSPNMSKDSKTITRFNYKDSYDKTEKFGVKRAK